MKASVIAKVLLLTFFAGMFTLNFGVVVPDPGIKQYDYGSGMVLIRNSGQHVYRIYNPNINPEDIKSRKEGNAYSGYLSVKPK